MGCGSSKQAHEGSGDAGTGGINNNIEIPRTNKEDNPKVFFDMEQGGMFLSFFL